MAYPTVWEAPSEGLLRAISLLVRGSGKEEMAESQRDSESLSESLSESIREPEVAFSRSQLLSNLNTRLTVEMHLYYGARKAITGEGSSTRSASTFVEGLRG